MRHLALLFLIVITAIACNLSATAPIAMPADTPAITDSPPLLATIVLTEAAGLPTLPPLPGLPVTSVPVTSVPSLGQFCEVYITYSGARADNRLSLRSDPSTAAPQIFRVPNQAEVLLVPGSQEVEAEGYHWLNVIYVESPQMRYQGWIARDSYEVGGVRDPSIATLQQAGTQSPC